MTPIRYIIIFFIFLLLNTTFNFALGVEIREWKVPYENSRPRDPYVDSQGRVWFCGQGGGYLAYLNPETGKFKKYDLEQGVHPHNLIVDKENNVWFAANTKPFIGKLDPQSGNVKKFPMPDSTASDPHTLVFDSRGDIWFTAQSSNFIGKLDTKTGEVKLVKIPVARARPYGIKVDSNDQPWAVLFGTNKIARVNSKTMVLTLFNIPRKEARPRRLEITRDNNIWYGDYAEGRLGRFEPKTGDFREWTLPGGDSAHPYGTAKDDKDNIWIAEVGSPNRLVGFNPESEKFISSTDIPNSRGAVRHMYFHPPSREIWFGEDSNFIGRAKVP